ncbi:hypothetical protein H4K34_14850 [Croceimicrobium hydrocarbonivorans]|uniref:Uncharacterized protein n=1 Tax=Croceimicrobium hydrocarbonivorans TaxID=2761580 RepID=A0A7H0VK30_9FLAO|nr:hypothetical protein H4K34_14850 [Croceimicrobium hydrocarbonivorans]
MEAGVSKLSVEDREFWKAISIKPAKWKELQYGAEGNGFWVVAIKDSNVIWYNDIEEGFNISTFTQYGEIAKYYTEQDELQWSIRKIKKAP